MAFPVLHWRYYQNYYSGGMGGKFLSGLASALATEGDPE